MNHEAEARLQGDASTEGRVGIHMNANVRVVVPLTASFGAGPPRAKEMKVDITKVSVNKGG